MLQRKESGVLCNLNIEKAYDHLDWDFLLKVMTKMGFGSKWTSWISWCISMVTFLVILNGSPSGFFRSSRSLRQGDPLSPYLFVIGMEALSCIIAKAMEGGFLFGCRFGGRVGEGLTVSHCMQMALYCFVS